MTPIEVNSRLAAIADMSIAELRAEWARTIDGPSPRLPRELLRRELAWHLQEKGVVKASVSRELTRIASGDTRPPPLALKPGAQLIREWQGRTIAVLVEDGGYLWEGTRYRSLSSIAKAVTGAHWSGPRFFGIPARG